MFMDELSAKLQGIGAGLHAALRPPTRELHLVIMFICNFTFVYVKTVNEEQVIVATQLQQSNSDLSESFEFC